MVINSLLMVYTVVFSIMVIMTREKEQDHDTNGSNSSSRKERWASNTLSTIDVEKAASLKGNK